jgi:hypothetical protein
LQRQRCISVQPLCCVAVAVAPARPSLLSGNHDMARLPTPTYPNDSPIHGLTDIPLRLLPTDIGCGTLAPRSQTTLHTAHGNTYCSRLRPRPRGGQRAVASLAPGKWQPRHVTSQTQTRGFPSSAQPPPPPQRDGGAARPALVLWFSGSLSALLVVWWSLCTTSQLDLFWPANFRPIPRKDSAWDAYREGNGKPPR